MNNQTTTNEIWKDIKGYEGLYQVSNLGRVKRLVGKGCKQERLLKPHKNNGGYLKVSLSKNGEIKKPCLHRLVMETYCPCENMKDLQVNHKSEIKTDNSLNNLEWCDAKYNANYGTRNERSAAARSKAVRCLDDKKLYPSLVEVEKQTGIAHQSISLCCRGKRKTAGGKHWVFEKDYQNMLVAELLEIAFCGEENEPEETEGSELVSICGQPLNDYLAMNEAI